MLTSTSVALLVTNGIFLGLAILAVLLRVIVRRSNGNVGRDDCLAVSALLFSTGVCLTNIISVPVAHSGADFDSLGDDKQELFLKFTFAWQFFYIFAVSTAKLSFLFFYGRFFRNEVFVRIQRFLIALVCAWTVAFLFATVFQILPVSCNWTFCDMTTDYPVMYICLSTSDIILDMAILALPLYMLGNVPLNRGKRHTLAVIFSLGAFCIVPGLCRLVYTVKYRNVVQGGAFSVNFTSDAVSINIWSGIEACVSTICACLPCFGRYVKKVPFLHRMAMTTHESVPWNGTADQYTGGHASTRSRGRSRFRNYARADLVEAAAAAQAPTEMVMEEGKDSLDCNSTKHILPPLYYYEGMENLGIPTCRHEFEPEIEQGRISLRTGSSSTETFTSV